MKKIRMSKRRKSGGMGGSFRAADAKKEMRRKQKRQNKQTHQRLHGG